MERDERQFTLTVPLDASAIQDREGEQELKIAAKDRNGKFYSDIVKVAAPNQSAAPLPTSMAHSSSPSAGAAAGGPGTGGTPGETASPI